MLFPLLFTQPFCFWKDHSRNAATLLFFVIPAIAPYIEYIKLRVENFHLIIQNYAKAMLCKFMS